MPQLMAREAPAVQVLRGGEVTPTASNARSVRILAKSLFRQLRTNGYDDRQIVALSSELIGLLTSELRHDDNEPR